MLKTNRPEYPVFIPFDMLMPFPVSEIDDLIDNRFGCLIGILISSVCKKDRLKI